MGCGNSKASASSWEDRMEAAEEGMLRLSGLNFDDFKRSFTWIEMDNKPFAVRTFDYGDKEKKTLVLLSGYLGASVQYYPMFKELAEHYRLVLFDHGSFGLNTRIPLDAGLDQCWGMESDEKAELWLQEWLVKLFAAADLPEKILLVGHSTGGYLSSMFASMHPERIEALFLMSPSGFEYYDKDNYDPYQYPDEEEPWKLGKKKRVDQMVRAMEGQVHPLSEMKGLPKWLVKMGLKSEIKKAWKGDDRWTDADLKANVEYAATAYERVSIVDLVELRPEKWLGLGVHSLAEPDRLGNPDLDFPIGAIFGDRDFLGSEVTGQVIKNSKHFASGRSQLFKLEDAGHEMVFENPEMLVKTIIGFFEGTIVGKFEEKPRFEAKIPANHPDYKK